MGYVPQDSLLFPHLTAREHVRFGGRKGRASRVDEAVALLELEPLLHRYPATLSGGERQRVALARAVMLEPEGLLIDNPLAGIDARPGYWWLGFLPRLAAGFPEFLHRNMTIVVTTDDFRPWRDQGTHFALVHEKQWSIIGGREDLEKSADVAVREVLAPDFIRKES